MQLNSENYFSQEADQAFFSASQIKSFKRCEAQTMAALRGDWVRPMSEALLQGQFVDEALTGNYGEWVLKHPEISKRDGNLKAEFLKCQEMVTRARRDDLFMSFMEGEHQAILTANLFGVFVESDLQQRVASHGNHRKYEPLSKCVMIDHITLAEIRHIGFCHGSGLGTEILYPGLLRNTVITAPGIAVKSTPGRAALHPCNTLFNHILLRDLLEES